MSSLGLLILIFSLLAAWWQWIEKDRYRSLYHDSLCNKTKEIPKKENEESLGIDYDKDLPHPFK